MLFHRALAGGHFDYSISYGVERKKLYQKTIITTKTVAAGVRVMHIAFTHQRRRKKVPRQEGVTCHLAVAVAVGTTSPFPLPTIIDIVLRSLGTASVTLSEFIQMDPTPDIPYDIGRVIFEAVFEISSRSEKCKLVMVSRNVRLWFVYTTLLQCVLSHQLVGSSHSCTVMWIFLVMLVSKPFDDC